MSLQQFYEYNFPFQFKDYFLIWKSTHQFEVKVEIIQLLAQSRPKKKFDVEKFLAPFDGLSNSKKTKIKKLFIAGKIDTLIFNQLQAKHTEYLNELDNS